MAGIKLSTLLTHAIGWLLFMSLPLLFISGQNSTETAIGLFTSPYYWMFFFCYAFIFYAHTYYILPEWYFKRKYVLYGISVLALLLYVYFLHPFDNLISHQHQGPPPRFDRPPPPRRPGPPGRRMHFDIIGISLFLLTLALSFAIVASENWRLSRQRAQQAETEKAQAELSILKAQINPHFLFNTLNNIYSLAVTGHNATAPSILQLSNILRYVTEDVAEDLVPLSAEIQCIRDYIDLQRLRLTQRTRVHFELTGNASAISIAPMILMTFVENAFKFGISAHENSEIKIALIIEDRNIRFTCINSLIPAEKLAERSGIGLANTRKRLDFIYGDQYQLDISETKDLYSVNLSIKT